MALSKNPLGAPFHSPSTSLPRLLTDERKLGLAGLGSAGSYIVQHPFRECSQPAVGD